LDWASGQTLNKEKMGNALGKDRRGKNLIECLKEARRTVQVRAIKGVAENQKPESTGSNSGDRNVLVPPNSLTKSRAASGSVKYHRITVALAPRRS
jgi:hypothetical protein